MERTEVQYHVIKEGKTEDEAELIVTVVTNEDGSKTMIYPDLVDAADVFDDADE